MTPISRWPAVVQVALGGVIGSAARGMVELVIPAVEGGFPVGVLTVNIVGSFLLGLYLARRERSVGRPAGVRFWAIGVLGSFTTFSAFSFDFLVLFQAGRIVASFVYLLGSVVGGLALALTGHRMGSVL